MSMYFVLVSADIVSELNVLNVCAMFGVRAQYFSTSPIKGDWH